MCAAGVGGGDAEVQDVFDLFDFWDGRDSMVDGVKVGDFLRCCGLNPTQALVLANGGTANVGTPITGLGTYILVNLSSRIDMHYPCRAYRHYWPHSTTPTRAIPREEITRLT